MLDGVVGQETFGWNRYLNQALYTSPEWRKFRRDIIIRDHGCDLGVEGFEINGRVIIRDHGCDLGVEEFEINDRVIVHHINPLTIEDVIERRPCVFDPNNVISTRDITHKAIHYSTSEIVITKPIVRTANDTSPWRK